MCRQKLDEVQRLRDGKRAAGGAGTSSTAADDVAAAPATLPAAVVARKALLAQRRALERADGEGSSSGEEGGDLLDVDWRSKR